MSESLAIGRSFLLRTGERSMQSPQEADQLSFDTLIDTAAQAIHDHPEVAAEITLAAAEGLITWIDPQDPLRARLGEMLERLSSARDTSMRLGA